MGTQTRAQKKDDWNQPILWLLLIISIALTLLFGWQTWMFISWLFPTDQTLARVFLIL